MTGIDAHLRTRLHSNYLGAMESAKKATVGIVKAGHRKRTGKTDIIYGKPLPPGSDENLCSQGNIKTEAVAGRISQLLHLLHGTSCFEVLLNRRMTNRTYW